MPQLVAGPPVVHSDVPDQTPKPGFDEILDALQAEGLDSEQAGAILGLFGQLGKLVAHFEETAAPVMVFVDDMDLSEAWEQADMPYIAAVCLSGSDARHEALDRVMPDLAVSEPGTAHAILEQGLLCPGDTFVHDRIGSCVIAVKRG